MLWFSRVVTVFLTTQFALYHRYYNPDENLWYTDTRRKQRTHPYRTSTHTQETTNAPLSYIHTHAGNNERTPIVHPHTRRKQRTHPYRTSTHTQETTNAPLSYIHTHAGNNERTPIVHPHTRRKQRTHPIVHPHTRSWFATWHRVIGSDIRDATVISKWLRRSVS